MAQGRKRKRQQVMSQHRSGTIETVRRLLPRPQSVFYLKDFVRKYAPHMPLADLTESCVESKLVSSLVVSPLETIKRSSHLQEVECREPLPSIVDDVVWALVLRRDRLKHTAEEGRNVLAQGYASPSSDKQLTQPRSHRVQTGAICMGTNDNVTFCKSSRVFHKLHTYVGDEILRMILLHTRLFLPVERNLDVPRGNFVLICGPPLQMDGLNQANRPRRGLKRTQASHNPIQRKKRRREGQHPPPEQRLQPNIAVPRKQLFYSDSYIPKIGLCQRHPLKDQNMTPEKLLGIIVDLCNSKGGKRKKRWRRLRTSGVSICKEILRGARSCDFPRLLRRHCPLPPSIQEPSHVKYSEGPTAVVLLQSLAYSYTEPKDVVSFVVGAIRRVFPEEFWGSERNFECLVRAVTAFVSLRRSERLSNKCLMHGIKVTDITWLHGEKRKGEKLSRSDHAASTAIALTAFRWLFRGFIIPLLRSTFYVTETEFSAKRVHYYRKPVWSAFRALSMKKLLNNQFGELDQYDVRRRLSTQRMGFSQLKLVPKATGVRPIAQLSRLQKVDFHALKGPPERSPTATGKGITLPIPKTKLVDPKQPNMATNVALAEVFGALTYETQRREGLFGAGIRGLSEFYPRYHRFVAGLTRGPGFRLHQNLYFASVDIEKCYDRINQRYLLDLSKRLLSQESYVIQQFNLLYANKVTESHERLLKKVVGTPEEYDVVHCGHSKLYESCERIVVDSRRFQLAQRSKLKGLLSEHLQNNLVVTTGRYGKRFLHQTSGISQGSVLSMLLCNLYYGEMEDLLLHRENPQSLRACDGIDGTTNNFMARHVDDFLFISTERNSLCRFLQRMHKGNADLGVTINGDKTLVSTGVEIELGSAEEGRQRHAIPGLFEGHPCQRRLFPWCGMVFDTETGEVYVDYERFQNGNIRDSLTVDVCGKEGMKLSVRMESFVRPRCLPILYDSSINKTSTIVINYCQMMILGAIKFAEYLGNGELSTGPTSNIHFLVDCVDSLATYAYRQVCANLKKQCPTIERSSFVLDRKTSSWISSYAFCKVLAMYIELTSVCMCLQEGHLTRKRPPKDVQGWASEALDMIQLEKLVNP